MVSPLDCIINTGCGGKTFPIFAGPKAQASCSFGPFLEIY